MQYRCLTDQELQALEEEFKQFLVANGVYQKEWREINAAQPEQALELVKVFSDIVFKSITEKARYLLHRSAQDLKVFHFGEEEIVLLGLKVQNEAVNLLEPPYLADLAKAIEVAGIDRVRLLRATKAYQQNPAQEIFTLLEQGCEITQAALFDYLNKLYLS